MADFFRGWRHKVGVVTLMMALFFIGAWMRSLTVSDHVHVQFFDYSNANQGFASNNGSVLWLKCDDRIKRKIELMPEVPFIALLYPPQWNSHGNDSPWGRRFLENPDIQWGGRFCGFGVGDVILDAVLQRSKWFPVSPIHIRFVEVPYWSIVLLLTLLSAFLLFGHRTMESDPDAMRRSRYEPDKNQELHDWLMSQKRENNQVLRKR